MTTPVKRRPFFTATAPSVTVLRSLASTAFGSYGLQLPEGIELEDVHDFDVPGNELGYVSSLSRAERVGGMARRFIRADVQVTAKDDSDPDVFPDSDVDQVLQGAEDRVSSDFYLGSDINLAGLNGWIPFVHFHVGDLADVDIWGTIVTLPVTRIEPIISDHSIVDFTVHVGDQLISDDEARQAENQTIHRALIQDRRELAGLEATASSAKKTAEQAEVTAGTAKETADTIDSDIDQSVTTVEQLFGVEGPEDKSGRLDFSVSETAWAAIAANTQAVSANRSALLLHENQLKWLKWTKHVFDFRFTEESGASTNVGNIISTGLIDVELNAVNGMGLTVIQRPGWAGRYRIEFTFTGGGEGSRSGVVVPGEKKAVSHLYEEEQTLRWASVWVWPDWSSEPREYALQVNANLGFAYTEGYESASDPQPIENSGNEETNYIRFPSVDVMASSEVELFYGLQWITIPSGDIIGKGGYIRPVQEPGGSGEVVVFTEFQGPMQWEAGAPRSGTQRLSVGAQTLSRNSWRTVARWDGLEWLDPVNARLQFELRFVEHNMISSNHYETRILINGTQVSSIQRNSLGGMNMHFAHNITRVLNPGDRIEFQALCGAGFTSERRVGSGQVTITWPS